MSHAPTLAAGHFFGSPAGAATLSRNWTIAELDATVPEREVPKHTHEGPHLVLVRSGVYLTEARHPGEPGTLFGPGTLIYNPGGTTHRDRFRSAQGRFLSLTPNAGLWNDLDRAFEPVSLVLHDPLSSEVHQPYSDLVRTILDSGAAPEAMNAPSLAAAPDPWLERAARLLEQNPGARVRDIATVCGVHPVSLARAFRASYGCSPGEFARRIRLNRLRDALLASKDTQCLADLAQDLGFQDQPQMTRAFTKATGIPPARFRRLAISPVSNRQDSPGKPALL